MVSTRKVERERKLIKSIAMIQFKILSEIFHNASEDDIRSIMVRQIFCEIREEVFQEMVKDPDHNLLDKDQIGARVFKRTVGPALELIEDIRKTLPSTQPP